MVKELITKLFDIETYESEYAAVSKELALVKHEFDIVTGANDVLARKVVDLEDKVKEISEEPDLYAEKKIDEIVERCKNQWYNRGFSDGRMSTFSEVGIWNIDAHERGNVLVRLSNDDDAEIVELLRDELVDVIADDDVHSERVKRVDVANVTDETGDVDIPDEIEIDDLIGA